MVCSLHDVLMLSMHLTPLPPALSNPPTLVGCTSSLARLLPLAGVLYRNSSLAVVGNSLQAA